MIYSAWGRVFGWSEFALRVLPLFAGLLALAWTYRAGRDLFAPLVGLVAAMLLATSVFFITYMHVARAFTLVVLFAVMIIWGYWRLALRPPANGSGRAGQLAFLVGSIGIFYTHYYAVLFLVGMGVWHLLFIPRDRRWWRLVLLFGLATIVFSAQLGILLRGITKIQTASWFRGSGMMRAAEVFPWFLYVLTNSISNSNFRLSGTVTIVVLILLISAVVAIWWRYRRRERFRPVWFLLFTTLIVLLLMLLGNEILLVVRPYRLRYLMALWPMSALLIGWGVWRTRGRWRLVAGMLTGVWVVFGLWANTASELRYEFYEVLERHALSFASREIEVYSSQSDLLLINDRLYQTAKTEWGGALLDTFPYDQYDRIVLRASPDSRAELSRAIQDHWRLWLLADKAGGAAHRTMIAQLPPDMVRCKRFIHRRNLALELYAWSAAHCPTDEPAQLRFGEEIELVASGVAVVPADMLRVDLLMRAESSTGMTAYSVAVHVFDAESGEKVAQGDQGLWLGRYNPLRSEMDISGLRAGDYELRVGVYDWQTLERLEGVDLTSGATGNLLPLFRFRVE